VTIKLYTDGACSGNPGPGGWGARIEYADTVKEMNGGVPDTTNNRMELTAIIKGLASLPRQSEVAIYTDSQYVKQGMESWIHNWKRNGWKTSTKKPVKNVDLWQQLDALCAANTVTFHWVKGHAGHPENERADALARAAVPGQG
jgi:ribonuclease HI